MSDTTPTPATMRAAREQQTAIDVVMKIVRHMVTKNGAVNDSESIEIIAAALSRERREALTEAAQVARAMYDHDHNLRGHAVVFATSIAHAIEAMRE